MKGKIFYKHFLFSGILFLASGFFSVAFAFERDIAVDLAIGGMEEGSRILAPETQGQEPALSPGMDTGTISSGPQKSAGSSPEGGISGGAGANAGQAISGGAGSIDTGGGGSSDIGTGGGGSGGTIEVTNNPIVDIDAGVDVGSGTIDAGVGVNPSGDQVLDADIGGSQIDLDTTTAEAPGDSTSPIIDVNAGADLDSGTVDIDVGVNPSGDQLLDADVAATGADTTGTVEADIGSATDVVAEDLTSTTPDLTTGTTVETAIVKPPSDLSAEVDTTGETVGGETDVGVEADVSGTGAGEDVVADPADGTSLGL